MREKEIDPSFWKNKKVFLTGHTGFKGSWLSLWLTSMGAEVTGFALPPSTESDIYNSCDLDSFIKKSVFADVKDLRAVEQAMKQASPDIVIHMAAQSLVRFSYNDPVETFATNVMGTVNVLESARSISSLKATIIVTTDKCYENKEWDWGYRENDPLGGLDPYSSSKGCAELVTLAYRHSFFNVTSNNKSTNSVASARAGNVIGGGDWSKDRLIPDAIRAFLSNKPLLIRNPLATRPWQHVLEPLSGYLILAEALYKNGSKFATSWNFGPRDEGTRSVSDVVDLLIRQWGEAASWVKDGDVQPHEAKLLKLDCSKAKIGLNWSPKLDLERAIEMTTDWYKSNSCSQDMRKFSLKQINNFMQYTNI